MFPTLIEAYCANKPITDTPLMSCSANYYNGFFPFHTQKNMHEVISLQVRLLLLLTPHSHRFHFRKSVFVMC